jgi:hypothetical protein
MKQKEFLLCDIAMSKSDLPLFLNLFIYVSSHSVARLPKLRQRVFVTGAILYPKSCKNCRDMHYTFSNCDAILKTLPRPLINQPPHQKNLRQGKQWQEEGDFPRFCGVANYHHFGVIGSHACH